ncbi:hypothetical protein MPLSOD_10302 [Mesorhizobium sp. SOD10]|nr:hypothetical protein MPLSOD_10302 [Mesorhizobium sp. SOD10]
MQDKWSNTGPDIYSGRFFKNYGQTPAKEFNVSGSIFVADSSWDGKREPNFLHKFGSVAPSQVRYIQHGISKKSQKQLLDGKSSGLRLHVELRITYVDAFDRRHESALAFMSGESLEDGPMFMRGDGVSST